MRTLARIVSVVMVSGAIFATGGCVPDKSEDRQTTDTPPPGPRVSDSRDIGPDEMLKSLGVGGSGVGAASAAIPENNYVATTNPSSAEKAEKAEKPKKDSSAPPAEAPQK